MSVKGSMSARRVPEREIEREREGVGIKSQITGCLIWSCTWVGLTFDLDLPPFCLTA